MFRVIGAALLLAALVSQPAAAALIKATASLDGLQQVPPNASTATGFATFEVDDVTGAYNFNVDVFGIDITEVAAIVAGGLHLHEGPIGVNGPIVVDLPGDRTSLTVPAIGQFSWSSAGFVLPTVIAALQAGNLYANLHTEVFPGGEIRGQLSEVPIPGALVLLGSGIAGLAWMRRRRALVA